MASSYPGGLDSFTNPAGSDPLNTAGAKLHSKQHGDANDAIEAIQATLGIDPQGAEADVAARLDAIEAGGGGGGGKAPKDRLWVPGSGVVAASSDEFDDATLDAAWVRVDASGGTSRATWTESGDSLSLLLDGNSGSDSAGEIHGLMRPYALAVGEYIETRMSWSGLLSNYPHAGLIVSDGVTHGAGTQAVGWTFAHGTANHIQAASWSAWGTRGTWSDIPFYGGPNIFMRLYRTASGTYALYLSPDGISFCFHSQVTGMSFTPSHIGVGGGLWTSVYQFVFSFSHFRVGS